MIYNKDSEIMDNMIFAKKTSVQIMLLFSLLGFSAIFREALKVKPNSIKEDVMRVMLIINMT